MTIHKAEKKDIIDLCDMWFELQNHHRNLAAYMEETKDWRSDKEKELLLVLESNNSQIFIARDFNGAVGYIRGCVKEMSPVFINPKVGSIDELFVREGVRGTGVGRKLVDHLKLWLISKGAAEIAIHVSCDNQQAKDFWNRMGFETTSLRMIKKI